jgi:hypothetical protein
MPSFVNSLPERALSRLSGRNCGLAGFLDGGQEAAIVLAGAAVQRSASIYRSSNKELQGEPVILSSLRFVS